MSTDEDRSRAASDRLASQVGHDPQLRAPRRPRPVAGLELVPVDGGLLIDGLPERRVLRGRAATTVVPALLAELDGTADGARGAIPPAARERALKLLFTTGLLEEDDPRDPASGSDGAAFLRRIGDSTRANRSGDQALQRLASTHVHLAGDDATTGPLAAALEPPLRVTRGPLAADPPDRPDLVVVATLDDRDAAASADAVARHAARGTRVLPVHPLPAGALAGPLVGPGAGCAACAAARVAASVGRAPAPPADELFLALVAADIVHLISRAGPTRLAASGLAWERPAATATAVRPTRSIGCPACGRATSIADPDEAGLVAAYEELVTVPPAELSNPRDHQGHFTVTAHALQHDRPPRPLTARIDAGEIGEVGEILRRSVGLRRPPTGPDEPFDRWAPTGGNLGSQQAFVASSHPALGARAWLYDPVDHALDAVGAPDAGDALRRLVVAGAQVPETVLVLSGALGRVAAKYGPRALRLVHLDAGVALLHAALAARERRFSVVALDRWPDVRIGQTLARSPDLEPVTGVLLLTGDPPPPRPPRGDA